jgi:hypothetical protein
MPQQSHAIRIHTDELWRPGEREQWLLAPVVEQARGDLIRGILTTLGESARHVQVMIEGGAVPPAHGIIRIEYTQGEAEAAACEEIARRVARGHPGWAVSV